MVIPMGNRYLQKVYVLTKKDGAMVGDAVKGTLFVPMTGRAQREPAAGVPPPTAAPSPASQPRSEAEPAKSK